MRQSVFWKLIRIPGKKGRAGPYRPNMPPGLHLCTDPYLSFWEDVHPRKPPNVLSVCSLAPLKTAATYGLSPPPGGQILKEWLPGVVGAIYWTVTNSADHGHPVDGGPEVIVLRCVTQRGR